MTSTRQAAGAVNHSTKNAQVLLLPSFLLILHLHGRVLFKVVVTRAGRLREGALISDRMVKQERVVAYEKFRDSLIIHKEKNKRNECLRATVRKYRPSSGKS